MIWTDDLYSRIDSNVLDSKWIGSTTAPLSISLMCGPRMPSCSSSSSHLPLLSRAALVIAIAATTAAAQNRSLALLTVNELFFSDVMLLRHILQAQANPDDDGVCAPQPQADADGAMTSD